MSLRSSLAGRAAAAHFSGSDPLLLQGPRALLAGEALDHRRISKEKQAHGQVGGDVGLVRLPLRKSRRDLLSPVQISNAAPGDISRCAGPAGRARAIPRLPGPTPRRRTPSSRRQCPVRIVEEERPLQLARRRRSVVAAEAGGLLVRQELDGHDSHRGEPFRATHPSKAVTDSEPHRPRRPAGRASRQ